MPRKNYHKILGVPEDATLEEIKRRYRKLALLYHPDRNNDASAAEMFKEINEAYAILSGKEKEPIAPKSRAERPITEDEYWSMSVIKIWQDMGLEHNNAYR